MSPPTGPSHRPTGWNHARADFHAGPPGWQPGLIYKRRFLVWRFMAVFSLFVLLFLAGLSVVLFLALGPARFGLHRPGVLALVICAVPLAFFVLVSLLGGWTFRRYGTPLAEVMAAADAVAEGDLSVRVRDAGPGEISQLARSFNRMTVELEQNEQRRRNLTADVAHELRTPLQIIQGNLEGLLDGVYTPTPEHLEATLEETRLLARLVNDLQMLSLAEAGQLPLHPEQVMAADLLADVVTSFSGQAAEAGVQIVVDLPATVEPLTLNVDPDRFDQVISNLVANALRYTPAGGQITLRGGLLSGKPAIVRLEVADNGAGIPSADLPYIFDRFWRGDRARGRRGGAGSGLGLAIAKQLVQAHGGRIAVESQPGQGATFTIDLPAGH